MKGSWRRSAGPVLTSVLVATLLGTGAIAILHPAPYSWSGVHQQRQSVFSASPAAASVVEFEDNFRTDSSLNTSNWAVNGLVANDVYQYQGSSHLTPVTPTIAFSSSLGLTLSGVTSNFTFAAVQTTRAFLPPFDAQTTVEGTASNGNVFAFTITTADGGQGIEQVGNLNASNPYYEIGVGASAGQGSPWPEIVDLDTSPALDTWYTLSLDVNASGVAVVTLSSGNTQIGTVSYYVGLGAYYLLLGQMVDSPPVPGPNSASWSDVYVNTTPAPPPPPTIVGVVANPAFVEIGAPTVFEVFVSGGSRPLTETYSGLPPGCASRNTSALSCTATSTGNYTVTVLVTDALGRSTSGEANLSVEAVPVEQTLPPELAGFVALPSSVAVGASTTFIAVVGGGTPPLAYAYLGLPPGCSSHSSVNLTCVPTQTGRYTVTFTVTDAHGRSATGETNLSVTAASGPGPVISPAEGTALGVGAAGVALGVAGILLARRRTAAPTDKP